MSGIIVGGGGAYEDALRQEYNVAKERLEARLKECGDPMEQEAVKKELNELKEKCDERLRGISRCLFGAR